MSAIWSDNARSCVDSCSNCRRTDSSAMTYRVKATLCGECARTTSPYYAVEGPNITFMHFCNKHKNRRAEYFCQTHDERVCSECQLTAHSPVGCKVCTLEGEIAERMGRFEEVRKQARLKVDKLDGLDASIAGCTSQIEQHFASIGEDMRSSFARQRDEEEGEHRRETDEINRRADAEIAIIEERRIAELQESQKNRQGKLSKIAQREKNLNDELTRILDMFRDKTRGMSSLRHKMENALEKAAKADEQMVFLEEFEDISKWLEKCVNAGVQEALVDQLATLSEGVFFEEPDYMYSGGLEYPRERWELVNYSTMRLTDKCNYMMGDVGDSHVMIKNTDGSVDVANLMSKSVEKVVKGRRPYDIYSCAALSDGRVACGTRYGEIVVYDQSLCNVLIVIRLSREASGPTLQCCPVSVGISRDNLIMAVAVDDRCIAVFDPNDGAFVKKISTTRKRTISELHPLPSSGRIVLRTKSPAGTDLCLVDAFSGSLLSVYNLGQKGLISMTTDRSRNIVYALVVDEDDDSEDEGMNIIVMSQDGGTAELDIDLPGGLSTQGELCVLPRSGKLAFRYDNSIAVFEKVGAGLKERIGHLKLN